MDPILLFDGECGFCASIVQFVIDHERAHTLLFAPLQGQAATRILSDDSTLQDMDSVIWVERDQSGAAAKILVRSQAALKLAGYLGGGWRALTLLWIVPRPVRDWAYDVVARHRHRLVSGGSCPEPTAENRGRFLE